jgi:hypothetical protein
VAAKVVKKSSPPVPTMAIEEARLIRETMGSGSDLGAHSHGAPTDRASFAVVAPTNGVGDAAAFPAAGAPGGGEA